MRTFCYNNWTNPRVTDLKDQSPWHCSRTRSRTIWQRECLHRHISPCIRELHTPTVGVWRECSPIWWQPPLLIWYWCRDRCHQKNQIRSYDQYGTFFQLLNPWLLLVTLDLGRLARVWPIDLYRWQLSSSTYMMSSVDHRRDTSVMALSTFCFKYPGWFSCSKIKFGFLCLIWKLIGPLKSGTGAVVCKLIVEWKLGASAIIYLLWSISVNSASWC